MTSAYRTVRPYNGSNLLVIVAVMNSFCSLHFLPLPRCRLPACPGALTPPARPPVAAETVQFVHY